jgi:hypothetical protein
MHVVAAIDVTWSGYDGGNRDAFRLRVDVVSRMVHVIFSAEKPYLFGAGWKTLLEPNDWLYSLRCEGQRLTGVCLLHGREDFRGRLDSPFGFTRERAGPSTMNWGDARMAVTLLRPLSGDNGASASNSIPWGRLSRDQPRYQSLQKSLQYYEPA